MSEWQTIETVQIRLTDIPEPIARVIDNNQPGWTNIIETAPNVTLDIGTPLYDEKALLAVACRVAEEIWKNESTAQPPQPDAGMNEENYG